MPDLGIVAATVVETVGIFAAVAIAVAIAVDTIVAVDMVASAADIAVDKADIFAVDIVVVDLAD